MNLKQRTELMATCLKAAQDAWVISGMIGQPVVVIYNIAMAFYQETMQQMAIEDVEKVMRKFEGERGMIRPMRVQSALKPNPEGESNVEGK